MVDLQNPLDTAKQESTSGSLGWATPEQAFVPNYQGNVDLEADQPILDPITINNAPGRLDAYIKSGATNLTEAGYAGLSNTMGASFQALVNNGYKAMAFDPEYNALTQSQALKARGPDFVARYGADFADSPNETYTNMWLAKIDRQLAEQQTMAENPVAGITFSLLGSMMDPVSLLSGMSLIKGGTSAAIIAKNAAYGSVISGGLTALQKSENSTMTNQDVLDATVYGAVFGGLLSGVGELATKVQLRGLRNQIIKDPSLEAGHLDMTGIEVHPETKLNVDLISQKQDKEGFNHSDLAIEDAYQKHLNSVAGSEGKVFDFFHYLSSTIGGSHSAQMQRSVSGYVTEQARVLGGSTLATNANLKGIASKKYLGNTITVNSLNHSNKFTNQVMENFKEYKAAGGKLGENDFITAAHEQSGGLKTDDQSPFIAKAAQVWKEENLNNWNTIVENKMIKPAEPYQKVQDFFANRVDKSVDEDTWLASIRQDHSKTQSADSPNYLSPEERLKLIDQQEHIGKIEAGLGRKLTKEDIQNPLKMVKINENYMTHNIDQDKVISMRRDWIDTVTDSMMKKAKAAPEERAEYIKKAHKITDDLLLREKAPFDTPNAVFQDKNLVYRQLDLSNEEIRPFLKEQSIDSHFHYIKNLETQLALTKEYGEGNVKINISNKVAESYQVHKDALDKTAPDYEEKYQALIEGQKRDVQNMHNFIDILTNQFNKDSGKLGAASRIAKHYEYLRLMGPNVFAQFPDLSRLLAEKVSTKFFAKHEAEIGKLAKTIQSLSREDLQDLGIIHGDSIEFGRTQTLGDIYDSGDANIGKVEKAFSKASKWYGKWSGLQKFNEFTRTLTANHVTKNILRGAAKLEKGLVEKGSVEMIELNKLGIDSSNASKVMDQYRKHSTTVKGADGEDVVRLNVRDWDSEVKLDFLANVRTYVDRIIIEPNAGDKPFWMQKDFGSMIGQFKGFMFASFNKGLVGSIQDAAIHHSYSPVVATKIISAMMLGYLSYAARNALVGKEVQYTPQRMFVEGFNRSGAFPLFDFSSNVLDQYGKGIGGMFGLANTSKYYNQGLLGPVQGPTLSQINDAPKLVRSLNNILHGRASERDLLNVVGSLPLQNHPLVKNAFTPLGN